MVKNTKNFIDKLLRSLEYTAKVAPWFWKEPKALKELCKHPKILERLRNDPAFFCTLLLRLPTGVFLPLPFQVKFMRDTSKRIVVNCGRQVGKTTMSAAKAVHFAITHDHVTVLVISKAQRQSMRMFGIIRNMFFWNPVIRTFVTRVTATLLVLKNNSQIIALPTGPEGETILGETAHMIIIDEANFIKPSIITETVFPMISSTDGYMIMLSTPEYAEHPFYQNFLHAEERGYSAYHFPSSIAPLPTKEAKLKFLAEQKLSIPFDEYQRQYLAILPDESNQLIPTKAIRQCVDATYQLLQDTELFFGKMGADFGAYDPGGKVNPAAFVALKNDMTEVEKINARGQPYKTTQRCWRLVYVRDKKGELYSDFTRWVEGVQGVLNMRKIGVDSKGVGGPLAEDLAHVLGKSKVEAFPIGETLKVDLFKWLRVCFEQKYIIIPDADKVIRQLKGLKWRWVKVGKKDSAIPKLRYEIYHPSSIPDDIVFALAIALYVAAQKRGGRMMKAW